MIPNFSFCVISGQIKLIFLSGGAVARVAAIMKDV